MPISQNLSLFEQEEPTLILDESNKILARFAGSQIDPFWAFKSATRKDTSYITHGYHRYPAKFIPQIASHLIDQYTHKGDLVIDPFNGCGTTLVEAKIKGRPSTGTDINPVAILITRAKKTPIQPERINAQFFQLKTIMANFSEKAKVRAPNNERIDYWFKPQQKHKLTFLLNQIAKLTDKKEKDFFLCALSNILKNCSMWMQKSTKPTRDFHKKPVDPFMAFIRQTQIMLKKNADFFDLLNEKGTNNISCKAFCCDARELPVDSGSASLVVTSPPYVTSYEYADLHQLSALWFEYTQDLQIFRKNFIGSSHHARHDRKPIFLNSDIAEKIRSRLAVKDKKKEHEVATYFSEMNEAFVEMKRVLKPKGRICIVIGNTSFKGVDILNAEVFAEQFLNLGFKMENLIKREIPSKNLPSTRDIRTGRFVSATSKNKFLAYPTEYILILQKL